MDPRWQTKGRPCAKPGPPSSVSERNCFSASFDGRCFQVRKLETGVPEGTHTHTHIHAPHWKTRVFNLQTWKRLLLNGRRNENLVCFLRATSRGLMQLWQAAGACLARKHTVPRHKVLELALKEYRMETCITHIQSRMEKLIWFIPLPKCDSSLFKS